MNSIELSKGKFNAIFYCMSSMWEELCEKHKENSDFYKSVMENYKGFYDGEYGSDPSDFDKLLFFMDFLVEALREEDEEEKKEKR